MTSRDRPLYKEEMGCILKRGSVLGDPYGRLKKLSKELYDPDRKEREGFLVIDSASGEGQKPHSWIRNFDETSDRVDSTPAVAAYSPDEEHRALEELKKTSGYRHMIVKLHTHTIYTKRTFDINGKPYVEEYKIDMSMYDVLNLLKDGQKWLRNGKEYVSVVLHIPTGTYRAFKLNTSLFSREELIRRIDQLYNSKEFRKKDESIDFWKLGSAALYQRLIEEVDIKEGNTNSPIKDHIIERQNNVSKQSATRAIASLVVFISLISLFSIFSLYNQNFSLVGQEILLQKSNYSIAGLFSLIISMIFILFLISRKK